MPFFSRYAIHDSYTLEELRRAYQNSDSKGRIQLLKGLNDPKSFYPGILDDRMPYDIALLAVEDPHVEVRQWIARYGFIHDERLVELLKKDPDPFVRACLRENPRVYGWMPSSSREKLINFQESTRLERLALVRNPEVDDELIQRLFDYEDKELGIAPKERLELVLAFLTNQEKLSKAARTSNLPMEEWPIDDYAMNVYHAGQFLSRLWHLASKWPKETSIQGMVYIAVPADDKTKAEIYKTCDEPAWRGAILDNCGSMDRETIELVYTYPSKTW